MNYHELMKLDTVDVKDSTLKEEIGDFNEDLLYDAQLSYEAVMKKEWADTFVRDQSELETAIFMSWQSDRVVIKTIDYQNFGMRRYHHIFQIKIDSNVVAVAFASGREGRDKTSIVWSSRDAVTVYWRFLMEFYVPCPFFKITMGTENGTCFGENEVCEGYELSNKRIGFKQLLMNVLPK